MISYIEHASSVGQTSARNEQSSTTGAGGRYTQLGPRSYENVNK